MQMKTIIMFIAVTLGVLLGVGGLLYQFGQAADKPIAEIAGNKSHKLGSGTVTVVEFSDFQCPACLSIQAPLKEILKKYEGKVEFVYRHFPLSSIHKNAQVAAQVAEAAGLQGKFFEMHDILFAKQTEWAGQNDPMESFNAYAMMLGLEMTKFEADVKSQSVKDMVNTDSLDATRYRLSGTPSFFVNGRKVEFAQLEAKILEFGNGN